MDKITAVGLVFFASFLALPAAHAAPTTKIDGIITQINLQDGTLLLRDRNGNPVTIKLPFEININLSARGVLDDAKNILSNVTEIKIKNATATDAIPIISRVFPGSGEVGAKVTLYGTGFTKKNNSVFIDNIPYAAVGIPSKDGLSVSFGLPLSPCDQRQKKCSGADITPGKHELLVANENGRSNPMPLTILPSPALAMETDILPQVVAKTIYSAKIHATGGSRSYVWRIFEGNLPQGLRIIQPFCFDILCREDLTIAGIPKFPGKYDFKISLTSGKENITRDFSIVVVQPIN